MGTGKVVLEWLGSHRTFGIYDELKHVERIHGHGGRTHRLHERRNTGIDAAVGDGRNWTSVQELGIQFKSAVPE